MGMLHKSDINDINDDVIQEDEFEDDEEGKSFDRLAKEQQTRFQTDTKSFFTQNKGFFSGVGQQGRDSMPMQRNSMLSGKGSFFDRRKTAMLKRPNQVVNEQQQQEDQMRQLDSVQANFSPLDILGNVRKDETDQSYFKFDSLNIFSI